MTAPQQIPVEARLLARREITPDGCWLWTGPVNDDGYGGIGFMARRNVGVHVVAFILWRRPLAPGEQVDHLCHGTDSSCPGGSTCRHRRCFNPDDLEATSQRTNILRGRSPVAVNAARVTCKHGHALTEDNVYRHPSAPHRRHCRACALRRAAEAKNRKKVTP